LFVLLAYTCSQGFVSSGRVSGQASEIDELAFLFLGFGFSLVWFEFEVERRADGSRGGKERERARARRGDVGIFWV